MIDCMAPAVRYDIHLNDLVTPALAPLVSALCRLSDQIEAGRVDSETRACVVDLLESFRELISADDALALDPENAADRVTVAA